MDPRPSPGRRWAALHEDCLEETRVEVFPALPPRLRPGDRLGCFRIQEEIARGATASIYAAESRQGTEPAALKVLSPHLAALPQALARFESEHALAARVEHPSIISVRERGESEGYPYYSMRRESGRTLRDLARDAAGTRDHPFFRRVSVLCAGVARALEALHSVGIVHRDVKPENILLGWGDRLVLCDFGSALDSRNRSRTLEACLWGTVRYMLPEQLRPGADPYDPAIDLHALGLSLYEAATGVSPFPVCSEEDLIRLKLTRFAAAPRRVNSKVPLGLDAIIRQAIDPSPFVRYSSAAHLAADLERLAGGKRGHRRS